jgi:hypothetical protein
VPVWPAFPIPVPVVVSGTVPVLVPEPEVPVCARATPAAMVRQAAAMVPIRFMEFLIDVLLVRGTTACRMSGGPRCAANAVRRLRQCACLPPPRTPGNRTAHEPHILAAAIAAAHGAPRPSHLDGGQGTPFALTGRCFKAPA